MSDEERRTRSTHCLPRIARSHRRTPSSRHAVVVDADLYDEANADDEGFWARQAADLLAWDQDWDTVLDWKPPYAKWFVGGQDQRFVQLPRPAPGDAAADKAAIIWEGEPGDTRTLTYRSCTAKCASSPTCSSSSAWTKGDRVSIYMPMVPELAIAMLACARIGAIHSRRSSAASRPRRSPTATTTPGAKLQSPPTAAGGAARCCRSSKTVDEALAKVADGRESASSFDAARQTTSVDMQAGRDFWWHELMAERIGRLPRRARSTAKHRCSSSTRSGSTGKPKGIKHTTAGYNLFVKKTFQVGLRPSRRRHLLVHGRLRLGHRPQLRRLRPALGRRDGRDVRRRAELSRRKTASGRSSRSTRSRSSTRRRPRSARSSSGATSTSTKHDLSSLRLLGTVGEGINPEAWMWYHRMIGGERCPIVDTWWQTETGGIMMSPLPGAIATKPGSCTKPLPGIIPAIVDQAGKPVGTNQGGWLVITQAVARHAPRHLGRRRALQEKCTGARCLAMYLAGDNARCDDDGYYWIMGRIDDVLNVSGHRLSTIEIEVALVSHPNVAEAAAVGRPDELKGEAVAVFVTLKSGEAERRPARRAQEARPQRNRRAGPARRHPLHRRAAQNPQRQDHAPPAPRHRRRQRNRRRHDDARRFLGGRGAAKASSHRRRVAAETPPAVSPAAVPAIDAAYPAASERSCVAPCRGTTSRASAPALSVPVRRVAPASPASQP